MKKSTNSNSGWPARKKEKYWGDGASDTTKVSNDPKDFFSPFEGFTPKQGEHYCPNPRCGTHVLDSQVFCDGCGWLQMSAITVLPAGPNKCEICYESLFDEYTPLRNGESPHLA